jgi:hypothetical protein
VFSYTDSYRFQNPLLLLVKLPAARKKLCRVSTRSEFIVLNSFDYSR